MRTGCCSTRNYLTVDDSILCANNRCSNYLGATTLRSSRWKLATASGVMAFCMLYSLNDFSKGHAEITNHTLSAPAVEVTVPLTLENLEKEIAAREIMCPEVVFAQIRIESANLTSFLTVHTNNMLGMRFPFKRKTTACGIYIPAKDTIIYGTQQELKKYGKLNNYAVYATWQDAVADYKLWQEGNYNNEEKYLGFLGKYYAEDPLYINKIKQMVARKRTNEINA